MIKAFRVDTSGIINPTGDSITVLDPLTFLASNPDIVGLTNTFLISGIDLEKSGSNSLELLASILKTTQLQSIIEDTGLEFVIVQCSKLGANYIKNRLYVTALHEIGYITEQESMTNIREVCLEKSNEYLEEIGDNIKNDFKDYDTEQVLFHRVFIHETE